MYIFVDYREQSSGNDVSNFLYINLINKSKTKIKVSNSISSETRKKLSNAQNFERVSLDPCFQRVLLNQIINLQHEP